MKNRTARLMVAVAAGLGMVAPAGAAMAADASVTPAPPVFRDACGTDKDEVVIPFSQGVDYYMSGVKVNPGIRPVNAASPRVEIFTRAQAGYTLTAPATWSHTFDTERGCNGEAWVKTGNVEPSDAAPTGGSNTQDGDRQPATPVEVQQNQAGTQVIDNTAEELPRTGFASDLATTVGVLALAGAGAAFVVNRRTGRPEAAAGVRLG